MDIEEKLSLIKFASYKYQGKKWDSRETKDFFDLEFSRLLLDSVSSIMNNVTDLLSYFDFADIFTNYNNELNDIQNYILRFMVIKGVKGVDALLLNMPNDLECKFFYQLYLELYNKDNRLFWFSKIVACLKKENIMPFINNLIDQVSDQELFYVIKDLYENKHDDMLRELMNNERIVDITVKKINAPFFYEMVGDLKLSNVLLDKRQTELENILNNNQDYEVNEVKEVYCDLYFHDTYRNVSLDVKTVVDFAKDDIEFRNSLGDVYNHLEVLNNLLNNQELDKLDIQLEQSINHEILSKCYFMCQQRFKSLVSESITNDVTSNIVPNYLLSSGGQYVKYYNIENQTEKQKNITMLVSTIPCSNNAKEFKQIYYSDNNGEIKNNRRSCSLLNETKLLSLFGGDNRITFGYEDLTGRKITSATLGDGRTDGNEIRFRKMRKTARSTYTSIDKFIAGTQGHTEITINMGDANKVMEPSYILITRENPTQFEIDVAAEFQIPIKYVNVNKYNQVPDEKFVFENYDYYHFEKNDIKSLKNEIKLT